MGRLAPVCLVKQGIRGQLCVCGGGHVCCCLVVGGNVHWGARQCDAPKGYKKTTPTALGAVAVLGARGGVALEGGWRQHKCNRGVEGEGGRAQACGPARTAAQKKTCERAPACVSGALPIQAGQRRGSQGRRRGVAARAAGRQPRLVHKGGAAALLLGRTPPTE